MQIYDNYSTWFFLGGMFAIHIGTGVLLCFFICRFLIVTYDPAVFLLLIILIGAILICDVLCGTMQMYSRFLIRLSVDETGITCRNIGVKSWCIRWCDICTYGITGYTQSNQTFALMFFSTDPKELYNKKQIVSISKQRIIIQIRTQSLEAIRHYVPLDMKKRLDEAIAAHRNCFCKR